MIMMMTDKKEKKVFTKVKRTRTLVWDGISFVSTLALKSKVIIITLP